MLKWIKEFFTSKKEPLVLTDPIQFKEEKKVVERPPTPTPTVPAAEKKPRKPRQKKAAEVVETPAAPKKRGRKPKTSE